MKFFESFFNDRGYLRYLNGKSSTGQGKRETISWICSSLHLIHYKKHAHFRWPDLFLIVSGQATKNKFRQFWWSQLKQQPTKSGGADLQIQEAEFCSEKSASSLWSNTCFHEVLNKQNSPESSCRKPVKTCSGNCSTTRNRVIYEDQNSHR
jgi:hypothetical protein